MVSEIPTLNREQFIEKLLEQRYFIDDDGTWDNLVRRVSKHASKVKHNKYEGTFYGTIIGKDFLPSRMPYMGTDKPFSSSCFVFDMEDNWESIFDCLRDAVAVQRYGGGTGYNFSTLRPKGDLISTTKGAASGPISFMEWFQETFQVLKRAGRKMAAQMAILDVSHPQIEEFIDCKTEEGNLWCFNISVRVTDEFMDAVNNDEDWHLTWNGEVRKTLKARYLFNKLVSNSFLNGEPGIVFQDEIDRKNKFPVAVNATNPSLRKGTKIITDNGVYPIEELQDKQFNVRNIHGEWSPADCFLSGRNKELYKIVLSDNTVYYCTAEHEWPVWGGYKKGTYTKKQTKDINVNDYFPSNQASKPFGALGDYSDGFLAGWIYGDGWITYRKDNNCKQVGMVVSQKDAANGILELLSEKLATIGVNTSFPLRPNDTYEMNTCNRNLNEWTKKFGIDKKIYGLPECFINQVSEDFTYGFFDGIISSDGHVSKKDGRITITSSYDKLAEDLHELLSLCGIPTTRNKESSFNNFGNRKTYTTNRITFSGRFCPKLSHNSKNKKILSVSKRIRTIFNKKVISIEKTNLFEDVWDISVFDKSHTFALPNVITGNCGEQALSDRTSCNLGAINLANHITDEGVILWDKLERTTRTAIRFLDGSLAAAWFPVQVVRDNSDKYRNIGLSVMGWHDFLLMHDVPYASQDALSLANQTMAFIQGVCVDESKQIGFEESGEYNQVNVTLTTVQPTGSLSVLAGVASAIEPFYAPIENRFSYVGTYSDIYTSIERKIEYEGWDKEAIIQWATDHETLLNCPYIPEQKRQLFASTNEIGHYWHVMMQAEFQKHVCQAVSKTINLPNDASPQDIWDIYMLAWEEGCKSITVYRQGSRDVEILSTAQKDDSYFCPDCMKYNEEKVMLIRDGGCSKCLKCEYSACTL